VGNLNGDVCREKRGRDESISGRGRRTVIAVERAVFVPVFVMEAWIDSTGFMSGPQPEMGAWCHESWRRARPHKHQRSRGVQRTRYLAAIDYDVEMCYLDAIAYYADQRVQMTLSFPGVQMCFSQKGSNAKKNGPLGQCPRHRQGQ
jgi:hypothetical protein